MARVAGICYIKVDGEQLEVSGGVEVPLSDTMRETVMGVAGSAGYKETAQRPFTKVSAINVPGFPIDKITKGTDMTVTTEMPNGRVYTLSGAFLEGEAIVKADDGIIELEFGGKKGQWQ
jgi:hypothetical protein